MARTDFITRTGLLGIAARVTRLVVLPLILFSFVFATASQAQSQDQGQAQTQAQDITLTRAQLEQLVAPIALYPDSLLTQVLMASTYPLEIVQAGRWAQKNTNLKGKALEDALQKQPWDPAVKSVVAVPDVLKMMFDKVEWIEALGNAFLAQQDDLMAAVQDLRARADAAGKLNSTPQQKVTKQAASGGGGGGGGGASSQPTYIIESADPEAIYVPAYDPAFAYGEWPYADYPPYAWYPPGYVPGAGLWFGSRVLAGAAIWAGWNWRNNNVSINPTRYNSFNRTNINNPSWSHNVEHRRGVPYKNSNVANKFGQGGGKNLATRTPGGGTGNRTPGAGSGNRTPGGNAKINAGGKGHGGSKQVKGAGGGSKQAKGAGGKGSGQRTASKASGGGAKKAAGGGGAKKVASGGGAKRSAGGGAKRSAGGGGPRSVGQARSVGGGPRVGGGGGRAGGGARAGGGGRGGGGGGGRGGGGRRSDIAFKHDIVLLDRLDNGLGLYRFSYNGSDKAYVGVIAQEVQAIRPDAVVRGSDGYLRVFYAKIGVKFQTYETWLRAHAL